MKVPKSLLNRVKKLRDQVRARDEVAIIAVYTDEQTGEKKRVLLNDRMEELPADAPPSRHGVKVLLGFDPRLV